LALRVRSPRCVNSVAIGAIADIARSTAAPGSDANDPKQPLARLLQPDSLTFCDRPVPQAGVIRGRQASHLFDSCRLDRSAYRAYSRAHEISARGKTAIAGSPTRCSAAMRRDGIRRSCLSPRFPPVMNRSTRSKPNCDLRTNACQRSRPGHLVAVICRFPRG
jgi:hypothetical protein